MSRHPRPSNMLRRPRARGSRRPVPCSCCSPSFMISDLFQSRPRCPSSLRYACWCRRLTPRRCARSSSHHHLGTADVRATHIAIDPVEAEQLGEAWRRQQIVAFDLHETPFPHFGASLAEYVANLQTGDPDEVVIIVVPEVIVGAGGLGLLIAAPDETFVGAFKRRGLLALPTNPATSELVRCSRYHKSCHPT